MELKGGWGKRFQPFALREKSLLKGAKNAANGAQKGKCFQQTCANAQNRTDVNLCRCYCTDIYGRHSLEGRGVGDAISAQIAKKDFFPFFQSCISLLALFYLFNGR